MNEITIISLGPGQGECLTVAAADALRQANHLILRTAHTSAADWLRREHIAFSDLDDIYEKADNFDELNELLTNAVMNAAEEAPLVYAVPDAKRDRSVALLMQADAPLKLLPGIGLFDPLSTLHPDARVCTASSLPVGLGDEPLLIVELDSGLLAGEVKLRLMDWFGASCPCLWYPPSNSIARTAKTITLEEIDRQRAYDHTAALYISPQPLLVKERYTVQDLAQIMDILRSPNGCPWDRAQTHQSLRPYLIEEAYEVTQAIQDEDWEHTADELGDVLLQVIFQANIGVQYGTLTLSDITTAICRKMIHRHPHVFSHISAATPQQVSNNWEALKRSERGQNSLDDVLRDIPAALPPLMRAQKAQKKAEAAHPTTLEETVKILDQLINMLRQQNLSSQAAGDLLFHSVQAVRLSGMDAEVVLSDTTEHFIHSVCGSKTAGQLGQNLGIIHEK